MTQPNPDVTDLAQVIDVAVRDGIIAAGPTPLGDKTLAFLVPNGFSIQELDVIRNETRLRHRIGDFTFGAVDSVARYVSRYASAHTLRYQRPMRDGKAALVNGFTLADYVIDDHPSDLDDNWEMHHGVGIRAHHALFRLEPTAAAKRWGAAIAARHTQESLLDLITDGIAEIGSPDGAELRDVVADLQASRSTTARSLIGKFGKQVIELSDNVALHSGVGTEITIPAAITVVFQPFQGAEDMPLEIKIKVTIVNDKPLFDLRAPDVETQLLNYVVVPFANELDTSTNIELLVLA